MDGCTESEMDVAGWIPPERRKWQRGKRGVGDGGDDWGSGRFERGAGMFDAWFRNFAPQRCFFPSSHACLYLSFMHECMN
jgi:hypothetical protein